MRRPECIAKQGGMPSGLLGQIVAPIMERETADTNRRAIELLDLHPGDSVLDVGCGNGVSLGHIASLVGDGLAAGLDHSQVMCRRASKNNKQLISAGRVRVACGRSDDLPYDAGSFDAAVSVHTLYFWNPAEPHFEEIARVLHPGGKFVMAFRPSSDPATAAFPASVYTFRSIEEVENLAESCGFENVRFRSGSDSETVLCATRSDY